MIETPLIVVDSNYLGHRAKHAMRGLAHGGADTGVVFGFMNDILSLAQRYRSVYFAFCWDSIHSYRKLKHPWYKQSRGGASKSPEDRALDDAAFHQFKLLQLEVLPDIGFSNVLIQPGLEGDDLMAQIVTGGLGEYVIVAADEDLYQLLAPNVRIWNPSKRAEYTEMDFREEWQLRPRDWVRVKAIAGCSSDEVPGVAGVGNKTAAKYLRGILKKDSKAYKDITSEDGRKIEERNLELVRLPYPKTSPISMKADQLSMAEFMAVCEEFGFNSFLAEDKLNEWEDFFGKKVLTQTPRHGRVSQRLREGPKSPRHQRR